MTRLHRTRAQTVTGRTLVGLGTAICLAWALLLAVAYSGGYSVEHTMTTSPGYLSGDLRDEQRQCLVSPDTGEQRRITVPAMPNRGIDINGTRLDSWFTGEATITCDQPTRFTQGTQVRFYPLIEQWLVPLLGLVLISGGLYRLGLFRHISRYPQ